MPSLAELRRVAPEVAHPLDGVGARVLAGQIAPAARPTPPSALRRLLSRLRAVFT